MKKNSILIPLKLDPHLNTKNNQNLHNKYNDFPLSNKYSLYTIDSSKNYLNNSNTYKRQITNEHIKSKDINNKLSEYFIINSNKYFKSKSDLQSFQSHILSDSGMSKENSFVSNDRLTINSKYNVLNNSTSNNQKCRNNHSFYESKYLINEENYSPNKTKNKNGNKYPSNIKMNFLNKENINISNILPNRNLINKNVITKLSQQTYKKNDLIKKPLTPFTTLTKKRPINSLTTDNKTISNNNKIKILYHEKKNFESKSPIDKIKLEKKFNLNNNKISIKNENAKDKIIPNKSFDKDLNNKLNIIKLDKSSISGKKHLCASPNINEQKAYIKHFEFESKILDKKRNEQIVKQKTFDIGNNKNNSDDICNNIFQKYIRLNNASYKIYKLKNETNNKNCSEKLNNNINSSTNQKKDIKKINLKLNKSCLDIPTDLTISTRNSNYKILRISNQSIENIKKNFSINNIPTINSTLFSKNNNNSIISQTNLTKNHNNSIPFLTINNTSSNNKIPSSKQKVDNSNNLSKAFSKKINYRENSYLINSKKYELGFKIIDSDRSHQLNESKRNNSSISRDTLINKEQIILSKKINYIKNCESISVPGINEQGRKKINQDSYIIERNINGIFNFNIFGVLDGHGEDGHFVSQFVSRLIINSIKNNSSIKKCSTPKQIYEKLVDNGYKIIEKIFLNADVQIRKEKFDYLNSGTTCIIIIQLEDKIICANTGDSRAILVYNKLKEDKNIGNMNKKDILKNSKIFNLSYDCKPELPKERKRIYECGGTVEKALDENDEEEGPFRVYAKGEDYPGLAMSRSIGDINAKKIGVIPNPQFVEYTIKDESKYMIICSDGVWEFISNEEAMNIANRFYTRNDASGLCQYLYKRSFEYWKEESIVVDDITAIVVFF